MPIYEYLCDDCGKAFEVLVSSSSVKSACPQCKSKNVSRQFSTFAAHSGGPASPCEGGACPSMSGGAAGSCAGGKCPFA